MERKGYVFNIQKFSLHDGDGIRTTVFLNGCNLFCKWCANPESRLDVNDKRSLAVEYSVSEIVKIVLQDKAFYDKSGGGVTLSGGDPLCQRDFSLELISALKKENVNVAIETAGNIDLDKFKEFVLNVDFVFIDCKHYDEQRHIWGTGVSNEKILKNIGWLARSGKPYCVRIPIIPSFNDSIEDALSFATLFEKLGVKNVQLLPFHQMAEKKYEDNGIEYAYKNVKQKKKEQLVPLAEFFAKKGIRILIGG